MSGRAKSVHAYPREFWSIVDGCANRGEVYEREVEGWQVAIRFPRCGEAGAGPHGPPARAVHPLAGHGDGEPAPGLLGHGLLV